MNGGSRHRPFLHGREEERSCGGRSPTRACLPAALGPAHRAGRHRHGAVGNAGHLGHGREPIPDLLGHDRVHRRMHAGLRFRRPASVGPGCSAPARPRKPQKTLMFSGAFSFRDKQIRRFGKLLANSLIRTSAVMDRTRGPGILERIPGRAIGSGHFGSVHQGPSGHDRRCRMQWRRRGPRGRWRLAHVVLGANRTSAGLRPRAIGQGHRLRWRCSATRSTRTGRATGGASIASAAGSRRWLSSPIVSHRARDKQFASTSGA